MTHLPSLHGGVAGLAIQKREGENRSSIYGKQYALSSATNLNVAAFAKLFRALANMKAKKLRSYMHDEIFRFGRDKRLRPQHFWTGYSELERRSIVC